MPIPGLSSGDFDQHYTIDGYRKGSDGQPEKTDYSYFRERIGHLLRELDALDAEIRRKMETNAVTDEAGGDNRSFAEMREEYIQAKDDLQAATSTSDTEQITNSLVKLKEIMAKSALKLGLDKDVERARDINQEVVGLASVDNALQALIDQYRLLAGYFKDDVVIGELSPGLNLALMLERSKRSRPR